MKCDKFFIKQQFVGNETEISQHVIKNAVHFLSA